MKIVIAGCCPNGGTLVLCALTSLHARRPLTRISHGCGDEWALSVENWAWKRRISTQCYPSNWDLYGRRAPEFRDQAMLNEGRPKLLLALGSGAQVARMKLRAKYARITVIVPGFELATGCPKGNSKNGVIPRQSGQDDIAGLAALLSTWKASDPAPRGRQYLSNSGTGR